MKLLILLLRIYLEDNLLWWWLRNIILYWHNLHTLYLWWLDFHNFLICYWNNLCFNHLDIFFNFYWCYDRYYWYFYGGFNFNNFWFFRLWSFFWFDFDFRRSFFYLGCLFLGLGSEGFTSGNWLFIRGFTVAVHFVFL